MTDRPSNLAVDIPPRDHGALYLFTVDLPPEQIRALIPAADTPPGPDQPLALTLAVPALLGSDTLSLDRVELFDLRDLSGLGLAAYLTQGYDIPADRLPPMLDSLTGHVLLVSARAATDGAALTPRAGVRFIARLESAKAAVSATPLTSDTARGRGGPAGLSAPGPAPRPAYRALAIAAGLTLAIAAWLWLTLR